MIALKSIMVFFLVLVLSMGSMAQERRIKSKIYSCPTDSTYQIKIIREDIFETDYVALYVPEGIELEKQDKKVGFKIFWYSYTDEGRFSLVVNPRQIYLRTGHDNPNPNYLFWLYSITPETYSKLSELSKDTNFINEAYTSETSKYKSYWLKNAISDSASTNDHYYIAYQNLKTIIDKFNSNLDDDNKIKLPNYQDFLKINRFQMVYSAQDLIVSPIIKKEKSKED